MMPLEIGWNVTVTWQAGDPTCRIMAFMRTFGLYLSSFVIVSISLDRSVQPIIHSAVSRRLFTYPAVPAIPIIHPAVPVGPTIHPNVYSDDHSSSCLSMTDHSSNHLCSDDHSSNCLSMADHSSICLCGERSFIQLSQYVRPFIQLSL